jgi:hypothetical protein
MRRIEMQNKYSPILSTFQLVNGAVSLTISVIVPALLFSATAYHPERNPEITHIFNDLASMCMFYSAGPYVWLLSTFGVTVLLDKCANRVLPRWIGYYNLATAILTVPAFSIPFHYSGPGAWNGKSALGIVIIFTGPVWCVTMAFMLVRAALKQRGKPYGSELGSTVSVPV